MIEVMAKNVCLNYPIFGISSRSLKKSFFKATTGGKLFATDKTTVIEALKDVSFHLTHGDKLALIGHNGAGKSTLLKILAGIYQPTRGKLQISGSVASLLDISVSMQSEATGYENIYISGLIKGLNKKQIQKLIPDIEEFTEMGKFLSLPLKTYSSGMRARLAFATETSVNAEILLVDESLIVGDANFKEKTRKRIQDFIGKAHIMILASHDDKFIKQVCNKALWLEHGRVNACGPINEVLAAYHKSLTYTKRR